MPFHTTIRINGGSEAWGLAPGKIWWAPRPGWGPGGRGNRIKDSTPGGSGGAAVAPPGHTRDDEPLPLSDLGYSITLGHFCTRGTYAHYVIKNLQILSDRG